MHWGALAWGWARWELCCLCFRPEGVKLSSKEGVFRCKVARATYYGSKIEYALMLGDSQYIVETYNPQLHERYAAGQEVSLSLVEGSVRVLR